MIKTKFKHGVIKYPTNLKSLLNTSSGFRLELNNVNKITYTLTHGDLNYLLELTESISLDVVPNFLFVKINVENLIAEYVIKEDYLTNYVELPTTAPVGKIAYNSSENRFYEFTDLNEWEEVLGFFLVKNKKLIDVGSQIGINDTVVSYKIKLNEKLLPIRIAENNRFRFLTENDSIKIENLSNSIKLKNTFMRLSSESNIDLNDIVSIKDDGTVRKANSYLREDKVIGLCLSNSNGKIGVLTEGIVRSENFNFSEVSGTILFLNESTISSTPPSEGFIQSIGYIVDKNSFYLKIDERILIDLVVPVTPTPTPSITPSVTVTPTITPSITPTITPTITPSITPSVTVTPTITPTPSIIPPPEIIFAGGGLSVLIATENTNDSIWDLRNQQEQFGGIATNGTDIIAVGASGVILSSTDGEYWPAQTANQQFPMNKVRYINNLFVAVGSTGRTIWSSDGITWTITDFTTSTFTDVSYGAGIYVAVGSSGSIKTSPDLINWTSQTSGTGSSLHGIIWDGSKFIVCGASGTILTSPDGITWTTQSTPTVNILYDIVQYNSLFVAVGTSGTVITSVDGISWTQRVTGTTFNFYGVASNGINLVTAGSNGRTGISSDGINWSTVYDAALDLDDTEFIAIVWSSTLSKFITVGTFGSIYDTIDGNTWNMIRRSESFTANNAIWDGNRYLIVCNFGILLESEDSILLKYLNSGTSSNLFAIAYNGIDTYVIAGTGGVLFSSNDAVTWTPRTSGTASIIYNIKYINSQFVGVTSTGQILTSNDGINWNITPSSVGTALLDITYNQNIYVAVGDSGVITTSPDLVNWTTRTSGTTSNLRGITYGSNKFVICGWSGVLIDSADGITWNLPIEVGGSYEDVTYLNGTFVIVGSGGSIKTSFGDLTNLTDKTVYLTSSPTINFVLVGSGTSTI